MTPEQMYSRAYDLQQLGHNKEAKSLLVKVIAAMPHEPEAHLLLSMILLGEGEWGPGWREYNWARKANFAKDTLPEFNSMWWNGMKLPGRLLVMGDQGFGDNFQFCRFFPELARRCAEVHVTCPEDLMPMFSAIPGVTKCYNRWEDVPPHHAHVRMCHLPAVLGTTVGDLAGQQTPYLFADSAKVYAHSWERRGELRVGFVSTGNPDHAGNDRRSIPSDLFLSALAVPNVFVTSLEKRPEIPNWIETAALVANLDLVVTVDTAVGHLAGAMGKQVWLLLPKVPLDWRWGFSGPTSPWYENHTIWRQRDAGDWSSVIQGVHTHLAKIAARDRVLNWQ